jgi:hypothetical protein
MSAVSKPLEAKHFPVRAEGDKLRTQDGTLVATVPDPADAADVAGRLNESRREEDKWSA